MRKMKDSGIEWIGEIPEHWNCSKAKYYIQISNGSDPKTDGDIPVYGSGSGCFKTCGESKDGPAVLLGRKGTVDIPRYIEGKYWNVDTAFDVKSDETSLLLKYYFYLSTCFDYSFYTATTTLPSMTQTSYENMFIPVPNIDMQHKIVAYIDSKCKELDMIITAKEKTNELLKERRQSIIYEAVTKGLDPTVLMKDSGIEWIGKVPFDWTVCKIKHFVVNEDGVRIGPFGSALTNRLLENGEYNVYSQANLIAGDFASTKHTIDEETFNDLRSYEVLADDICVSMMGTIGKCMVVPNGIKPGIMDSHLIKIRLKSHVNPKFFEYVYDKDNSGLCFAQMKRDSKGTIMDGLNSTIVKNLFFPLPSLDIQNEIVDHLDETCCALDTLITANESTIAKLKEYRQSVIYEAVTGKIEV